MLPEKIDNIEGTIYAGFWRRFGALWLDFLIVAPWNILVLYITNADRLNILYTIIPSYMFFIFYSIYCVKRWGGTPGKLILKIIIVNCSGNSVGWKEAILRHSVDFFLGMLINLAMIVVLLGMTDDQYSSMKYLDRGRWIMNNLPFWHKPAFWLNQIWVWSEFIVLLCNKRKRALHDYIAGTVVIMKKYVKDAEQFYRTDAMHRAA